MKPYRIIFTLTVISHFLPGFVIAKAPPELDKLRFEFQVELAELNRPLQELNVKYRGYLEKQKAAFQKEGNLRALLEMEEELKSFEKAPGEKLSSLPELKRLQRIYREQRAKLENGPSAEKLTLIAAYRKKAEELSTAWTKEGSLEDAKLALAESERFAAMEALAKAAGQAMAARPAARSAGAFEGKEAGEEIENALGMKLCWNPAGRFRMGSPEKEEGRRAASEAQEWVVLTRGFWMGKFEVTQEEYETVTGTNPARKTEAGKRAPVDHVSWEDAMTFCAKLTEAERKQGKLPEGWAYTLPTEAQWEYACRSGERGPYSGGELDEVAWYKTNAGGRTQEVGQKKANAWGLHDMHGNLWEWCADWYADTLLGGKDPIGPDSGTHRVGRGGNWADDPPNCRAAQRVSSPPSDANWDRGFRVCVSSTK